jgi:predicted metal-dependent peptidase
MSTALAATSPVAPVSSSDGFTSIHDVLAYLVSYRIKDFYARLVSALPSRPDNRVPMVGVMFEKGHHVFLYNDAWVQDRLNAKRQGFDELRAAIAHEAEHVILAHIARQLKIYRSLSAESEQKEFRKMSNVGADMAVNVLLKRETQDSSVGTGPAYPHIHSEGNQWILPEKFSFPDDLTYEWYLSLLMDPDLCPQCAMQAAKDKKEGKGDGSMPKKCPHKGKGEGGGRPGMDEIVIVHGGAHELWDELSEELTDEEVEVLVSQIEGDAYEKVTQAVNEHKKARGTVPGFVEEELEQLTKPPTIPWKKLLHQYVQRCRMSKPLRSMQRPRKRWLGLGTTLYPGMIRDRTFNLYFAIDTSGSMSSEDLLDGLTELQGITRIDRDVQITVVEFDTEIHKEYKLKANQPVDVNLRGRGGTDFNKAFGRAKELGQKGEVDAVIIYTDGYAPSPELEFRPKDVPVLWCLTDGGQHPSPEYGIEIRRPRHRPSY